MSFGFSVGDFIAGANLAYKLIRALSETQGATMEYQEAIQELGCIQQTFLHVGNMRASNLFCQATLNAIAGMVHTSKEIITKFLEKTEKYRRSLSGARRAPSLATDSWRKIGWSLYKKQELVDFKMSLRTRLIAINVLVSTANHQNQFKMPQAASKSLASNPNSKTDKQVPLDPRSTESTINSADQVNVSEEKKTKTGDGQVKSKNSMEDAFDEPVGNKNDVDREETSSQDELEAAEKGALDAMVRFKLMHSALQEQRKMDKIDEELERKKPIQLKDSAGRKYSFPFHLCLTWQGMQDVIRRAFGHAQEIGPQIEEGHYDLVSPEGDTILPQLWSTMVQPGWSVAMHVWPAMGMPGKQTGATTREVFEGVSEGTSKETSKSVSKKTPEEIQESASSKSPGPTPKEHSYEILDETPEEALTDPEGVSEAVSNEILEKACEQIPEGEKSSENSLPAREYVIEATSRDTSEGNSSEESSESSSNRTSQRTIPRPSQEGPEEISKPTTSNSPFTGVSDVSRLILEDQEIIKQPQSSLSKYTPKLTKTAD